MPLLDVSVVIPTWNGRRILEEFFPSVVAAAEDYARESGSSIEIIVVDDGSTDDTVEWLESAAERTAIPVRTIALARNVGFAEACNRGVREARHPLVLLLNNDIDVPKGAIAPLAAHFVEERGVFAVHCRVVDLASERTVGRGQMGGFARGFLRVHGSFEVVAGAEPPFPSMFASGGSAMFDRRIFLELGGFDPLFAPYYYEDVEISYRAWKRGFTVEYEPASTVRHRFSSTIGAIRGGRVRRISQRNRLLLHWIHLHDRAWLAQHTILLPGAALAGLLTLRPHLLLGAWDALGHWTAVKQRRARERREARRSDRDVVGVFTGLRRRAGIRAGTKKRPA